MRKYFLVFQNKSYWQERTGGFLWAPKWNKEGKTFSHWKEMINVEKGDIIFSSYQGKLVSIITAKVGCTEHKKPGSLSSMDWENDGWLVEAEYFDIEYPLVFKEYMEDILKLQGEKYAPFNKLGRGNTGYLFKVTEELAHYLIEMTISLQFSSEVKERLRNYIQ